MSNDGRPLKILHLLSSERWTGAAEPAAKLAAEQMRQGNEVYFACIGGSSSERRVREMGLAYAGGFHFDRRLDMRHFRDDLKNIKTWCATHQPDILHCHLPHDHWIAALALRLPLSRRPRPAIVRTMHRAAQPRRDTLHRWQSGKGADMLIAVSTEGRQAMIEEVGLPPNKVAWVKGSVDLERFHPDLDRLALRDFARVGHNAPMAGMVARMRRNRGHHEFIDAIDTVAAAIPGAIFALAGRGELKYEIKERIEKHPLRDHLRTLGYRKYDLPETYAAFDVAVLLRPGSDGACRAMLEAMACGRPVVGARIGAIADAIEPGKTGWLVEPGDRDGLARSLIEALSDREATRAMGVAARQWVEENYGIETQYLAVRKVYGEAIRRRDRTLGRA